MDGEVVHSAGHAAVLVSTEMDTRPAWRTRARVQPPMPPSKSARRRMGIGLAPHLLRGRLGGSRGVCRPRSAAGFSSQSELRVLRCRRAGGGGVLRSGHGAGGGVRAMPRRYEVIIVGAGPAGAAAALTLAGRDRALAARSLLLDAAVFPRDKLCAGGLVPQSDRLLAHLGAAGGVASLPIREMRFEYPGGESIVRRPGLFRVVSRTDLDHALLRAAAERGIHVHEGEPVFSVTRTAGGLRVTTSRAEYRAEVVIGADGATSRRR